MERGFCFCCTSESVPSNIQVGDSYYARADPKTFHTCKVTGVIKQWYMRGKFRGIPVYHAKVTGNPTKDLGSAIYIPVIFPSSEKGELGHSGYGYTNATFYR